MFLFFIVQQTTPKFRHANRYLVPLSILWVVNLDGFIFAGHNHHMATVSDSLSESWCWLSSVMPPLQDFSSFNRID